MKTFFVILFALLQIQLNAQEPTNFTALKQAIINVNPEVDFANKLVFISVWKSSDFESRELNKEAFRVYKIYKDAKLKNGEKGTVFISLNLDQDSQITEITTRKDSLDKEIIYTNATLLDELKSLYHLQTANNTILIDKTGDVKYTNLSKDQIFVSLRSLITR
ncbi:MAG: hypothetical protein V4580_00975 [Bacteroidota bacterium]